MKNEDTTDAIIKKEPVNVEDIKHRIFEVRGMRVMLDRDLSELYGVETRALNQAVKRNMERFPEDFMFRLNKIEWDFWKSQLIVINKSKKYTDIEYINIENNGLKSQFVISNRGGDRALPYAFTELGIAMLSSVLRSETAIQVNINIMRAFVMIRQTVAAWQATNLRVEQLSHKVDALSSRVDEMLREQHENNMELAVQIDAINNALDQLREPPEKPRKRIGFNTKDT